MILDHTADTLLHETVESLPSAPGDARSREPAAPPSGRIGRFTVLRQLGEGGMGVVLAAYDPELDRAVALKLIHPSLARYHSARARLVREAQALAKLAHPNVVAVHDVGAHEGRLWLSMELVEGKTLRRWLAAARRGWREVLEVMKQTARGVAAAHRAGVLHRDLKPENIMVGDYEVVRRTALAT
ncbi:MAG: serine/threonine protein kinase [Myxococcales bacterium]|nr:serine/threonine protein kinase [Myxococcales bacterium]